ncbi:GNAT family N-acetyltransferase [Pseudomonadota bacterium]
MMSIKENHKIREVTPEDSPLIRHLMDKYWGGEPLMVHDKKFYPSKMEGLLAYKRNEVASFLIYEIRNKNCEIIVFEVFEKFHGLGTIMLKELKKVAKKKGCKRIYLMTTNDNLDALRFYQKRGFIICGIHLNTMEEARKKKPSIPELGDYDIPLRDEIDLELMI